MGMIRTLLVARQLKVHYQVTANQAKQTSSSCHFFTSSIWVDYLKSTYRMHVKTLSFQTANYFHVLLSDQVE